jgi:NIPSNAP
MIRAALLVLLVLAWMVPLGAGEKPDAAAGQDTECACEAGGGGGNEPQSAHRVFELRTYYLNEGKLDDLHKRFRDHTCGLLKKHGAELIGFWTPMDEKDGKGAKLIYMVAFPSREAANRTWEEFGKDPEWRRVYEESHKNGVLVKKVERVFMEPTDYSEMK